MIMLGVNDLITETTPNHEVGERGCDTQGREYIYGRAAEILTQYAACVINEAVVGTSTAGVTMADTTSTASAFGQRVGIASVAFADDDYGWFQVLGRATVLAGTSCAANTAVNSTATGGTLDDDATTGAEVISGLVFDTAESGAAGSSTAILNYPTVGATL